jgi:non-heme chloroperoxidase
VPATLTAREHDDIERANKSGVTPVVLVHGLWLPASSWLPWRGHLEEQGFATIAPGWPGEPGTVEEARRRPGAVAGTGVGEVTDHVAEVVASLDRTPVVIGHSFGGLVTQQLASRGLAVASVAIGPAPSRGVLALPATALRAASVALAHPGSHGRSVMLTATQFRFAFGNALPQAESDRLYDSYCVPAPARPLFQAATANLDPRSEAAVDTGNRDRGPMLIISGQRDNTVPWAIAEATYRRQARNPGPTELTEAPGRGHSLTVDRGWREVADNVLAFLARHRIAP